MSGIRFACLLAIVSGALLLCVVLPAEARHCRVAVKQAVVVPYVQPYAVNYFVGQPVRLEAMVQQALKSDPEYAEFQRFRQWQSLQAAPQQHAEQPAASMLKTNCGTCHSGATPKAGLILDGSGGPLDPATALKAMQMIRDGQMPPKKELDPDTAGAVFSELLDLVPAE